MFVIVVVPVARTVPSMYIRMPPVFVVPSQTATMWCQALSFTRKRLNVSIVAVTPSETVNSMSVRTPSP